MKDSENNHPVISIPYIDTELSFWEKIALRHSNNIAEVYIPFMDFPLGSGRPLQPADHLVSFLSSRHLPVSLLINPIILPSHIKGLEDKIFRAVDNYCSHTRIISITLTDVCLAGKLKIRFPQLKLIASTLLDIRNSQQLAMVGNVFDTIVPSQSILRNLEALTLLRRAFDGTIRLLVNESCLPSCLFRTKHFFEMSQPEIRYPGSLCNDLLNEKPWLRLTGNWVLPQHLRFFDGIYDELKLAGRVSLRNPSRYTEVLEAYLNGYELMPHQIGGGPAAVNQPMYIDDDFYRYTLSCDRNCITCSRCNDYWRNSLISE